MTTIIENDLRRFFAVAGNGPVAQAAIVPVQAAVTTNLLVTYNEPLRRIAASLS